MPDRMTVGRPNPSAGGMIRTIGWRRSFALEGLPCGACRRQNSCMGSAAENLDVATRLERSFRDDPPDGVQVAYLFGSHAEGRAHDESDVDVAVLLDRSVFPDERSRFDERVRLTSRIVDVTNCNQVDVVVLNDAPPLLGRHIVARGQQFYCTDPAAAHAAFRDFHLLAADLEPFLRKTARIKLGAIAG